MTRRLIVSERAEEDLRKIWLYSFETWGEAQADYYLDELSAGVEQTADSIDSGV